MAQREGENWDCGASNLVEKRVESPRPVKTQNSLRPQNVALEPKLEPGGGIFASRAEKVRAARRLVTMHLIGA